MLREAREQSGLSLGELARRVGSAPEYISEIERGLRHPSRDLLERLAHVLGAPKLPEEYLTREDVRDVRGEPTIVVAVKRLMRKWGIG